MYDKRKKKQSAIHPSQQAATWLARKIIQVQRLWAAWMNRQADRLSLGTKKVLLALFVLLIGSYCFLLLTGRFRVGASSGSLEYRAIKTPALPDGRESQWARQQEEAAIQRIKRFRLYIDSLDQTPLGRQEKQRLLGSRPGLMDSLKLWESLQERDREDQPKHP